jgi:hypothetical protein
MSVAMGELQSGHGRRLLLLEPGGRLVLAGDPAAVALIVSKLTPTETTP